MIKLNKELFLPIIENSKAFTFFRDLMKKTNDFYYQIEILKNFVNFLLALQTFSKIPLNLLNKI